MGQTVKDLELFPITSTAVAYIKPFNGGFNGDSPSGTEITVWNTQRLG